jgi:hypothetical protein
MARQLHGFARAVGIKGGHVRESYFIHYKPAIREPS